MLLGASAALCGGGVALAHEPVARIAANCSVGSGRGDGYTYVTSLSVRHASCSAGKSLVKHHGSVRGWRCTKKRLATSPVQYQERETCTHGSRSVVWGYTQNT